MTTIGKKPTSDKIIHHILNKNAGHIFRVKTHGLIGQPGNSSKNSTAIVDDHIRSYNPEVSHYRRLHAPKRLYLSSELTITSMYENYIELNGKEFYISYEFYRKRISSMNISFTKLGCELCELCDKYSIQKDGSVTESEFNEHQHRYRIARNEYRKDVASYANCENTICVSVDLQKVLLLPHMPCYKAVIFTSRLIVFNETFVPVGTSDEPVFACVWHEGISGRNKDLISTYFQFIMKYKEREEIIIWLDNCSAQNKNWALMTFLVFIINVPWTNLKMLSLKYFESGHTFMSADSFHHQVELKIEQKGVLNDYFDLLTCIQAAKSGNVHVKDMAYSNFYECKNHESQYKLKKNIHLRFKNVSVIQAKRGFYKLFYKTTHAGDFEVFDFLQNKKMNDGGIEMPVNKKMNRGIS